MCVLLTRLAFWGLDALSYMAGGRQMCHLNAVDQATKRGEKGRQMVKKRTHTVSKDGVGRLEMRGEREGGR